MGQKNNGKSAAAFKFLVCAVLILLLSETAFAQASGLTLNLRTDTRLEPRYSPNTNAVVGYNLYVRKKAGMESVMLTEPTGYYALRTPVKYEENDAIRNLSGKRLPFTDLYSRYSIISSTPIQDSQLGGWAFKLFIPATVIYGNPSSRGPFSVNVVGGFQFNIRTFDQKYGDPNRSTFRNNLYTIGALAQTTREVVRPIESASALPYNTADSIKRELSERESFDEVLSLYSYEDLKLLLITILESRGGM